MLLSGANDIIVVMEEATGNLKASPFNVQFGKKDVWLPRVGRVIHIIVNGRETDLAMILDKNGRGYFPVEDSDSDDSDSDLSPEHMRTRATPTQLDLLYLKPGRNEVEFKVTSRGSIHNNIYLLNDTQKIVISDIDGTITRSDVRGFVFPVLGLSDWKHSGVVTLYSSLATRGYQLLYLSARSIGHSSSTHDYLASLREGDYSMPAGPVLLHEGSVAEEVFRGTAEISKISKLLQVQDQFSSNPFYSAYGNRVTDSRAYKALGIDLDRIYMMDNQSFITSEGNGMRVNFTQHIDNVNQLYPISQ